jgi:hypothetical protein
MHATPFQIREELGRQKVVMNVDSLCVAHESSPVN